MYQALYRKYRPRNFEEVVGQTVIVKTLNNEIMNNKISHAYLFTGPRGTGKTSVAKILAKTINCTDLVNGSACNKCVSCTQINNNNNVDIIEIDAASNNGVDEIRELKSKVNLVPSNSKYKIYIIDEVHMMTTGAFNALLKTLEEPPTHVIFILATTDPQKIPNTILSRCQRLDFKRIDDNYIISKLKYIVAEEKIVIDEESLKEIARISDGGMRDAIGGLDQAVSYAGEQITIKDIHDVNGTVTQAELLEMFNAIVRNDVESVFKIIDTYNNQGKNFVKLTEELIYICRNLILVKMANTYFKKANANYNLYEEMSQTIDKQILLDMVKIFTESLNEMNNSLNVRLLFELMIIKVTGGNPLENQIVEESKPKTSVINKIEEKKTEVKNEVLEASNTTIEIDTIKEIRINNALANVDKTKMQNIAKQLDDIRTLIVNSKYETMAGYMIDAKVKAFGNQQIVLAFEDIVTANNINANLILVEEMIEKITSDKYKVIAVCKDEWDIIKKEFNSKSKKYSYIEENFNIQMFAKKVETVADDADEIAKTFGNLVKYK